MVKAAIREFKHLSKPNFKEGVSKTLAVLLLTALGLALILAADALGKTIITQLI